VKTLLIPLFVFFLSGFAHAEKATWARSIYLRGFDSTTDEKLTDQILIDFALKLKRTQVSTVYIFAGPFQKTGHLPSYALSDRARKSVATLKKIYPQLKILPWIGGVQDKTVFLNRDHWIKSSIQATARLIQSGFYDGVHIDFEYVLFPTRKASKIHTKTYDAAWVSFYQKLREALPDVFISTVVAATPDGVRPWKHKQSLGEIKVISQWVDQIGFMFYETGLHDLESYRANLGQQLEQIQELKNALKKPPKYLLGVGAFKSENAFKDYRDLRFENLDTTLTTLKQLKNQADGLALYCEWQASPSEWSQFSNY
jgi:hypothetical protein